MSAIIDVKTVLASVPLDPSRGGSGAVAVQVLHVTIVDDAGHSGTGFTYSLAGGLEAAVTYIEASMKRDVLGSHVDFWPRTWESIRRKAHRLGSGITLAALSAIDIAVWDLKSRRADRPLYRFLGAHRESVPIYGGGLGTSEMTPGDYADAKRTYVDDGFMAVKVRVGRSSHIDDLRRVEAVRDAVGNGVHIMVDCNENYDLPTALWMGRRLEELGVFWLEEPLRSDDRRAHAILAQQLRIAVAVGEHLHGRLEFASYINAGAASVVQPDAPVMGGITEWLHVASYAEAAGATISPHFLPELHVHLALAVPHCQYIEHFPLIDDLLLESVRIVDGVAYPPTRPGHGLLWDEDALDDLRVA